MKTIASKAIFLAAYGFFMHQNHIKSYIFMQFLHENTFLDKPLILLKFKN